MVKKILAAICLFLPVSVDLYGSETETNVRLASRFEANKLKITYQPLECKKAGETCYRERDDNVKIDKIITCITVGQSAQDAISVLEHNGTGYHFLIDENGGSYQLVPPHLETFAAGPKYNPSSVFVGLVNPGAWIEGRTYNEFWKSQPRVEVNGTQYFSYPQKQIETYNKVVSILKDSYNILDSGLYRHEAVTEAFPYYRDVPIIVRK